ncbi:MAG: winged helix-turn-helix transcriptional regulator [Methanobacteriota archaeon]|nr:MAG: winged helix-turn-helix transcriptional regulator [Euryarchaeota archaeon]
MRGSKVIKDPKAFTLIGDETRRKVIYLLRAKEMTVSQIAAELNLTPQAIYHHIAKLKEAGMVEVAREERVDHFIETYYRATAEIFQFSYGTGPGGKEYAEKEAREALMALPQLGFTTEWDDATVQRLVKLQVRMEELGTDPTLEDQVQELENVGFLTKQHVSKFLHLLAMSDAEFEEYLKLHREMRDAVRTTVTPKVRA